MLVSSAADLSAFTLPRRFDLVPRLTVPATSIHRTSQDDVTLIKTAAQMLGQIAVDPKTDPVVR